MEKERTLLEMLETFANIPAETEDSQRIHEQLARRTGDIEKLLDAAEFENRLLAACALARLCPAKADVLMPILIEGLRSEDEAHRVYAAFACRSLGPLALAAVAELIDVLDGDEIVVNHAIKALEAIGPSAKATPRLVAFLRTAGPNALMVENVHAINAAMALRDSMEAIPDLRACLHFADAEDDLLRTLALESARAIWHISGEAEAPLRVAMQLLTDEDDTIKAHAADLLGEMGTAARPALAGLQRLLGDESEYVRRHAREAMARIETPRNEERK